MPSNTATLTLTSSSKDSAIQRVAKCGIILTTNLAIILIVPLIVRGSIPLSAQTIALLMGCCVMCAADLTRLFVGTGSEVIAAFGKYQFLSAGTAMVLLAIQWGALCEFRFTNSNLGWIASVVGLLLLTTGAAIRALAILQLGRGFISGEKSEETSSLVIDGIYSRLRHPSETGLLLCVTGLTICTQAWYSLVVGFAAALILARLRMQLEESNLLTRHGDEYRDYCSRTNRWLPL